MTNNDVLRSIRYMLDISEGKMADILSLANYQVSRADVIAWLKSEEDEGYIECSDTSMQYFLDGLIYFRRGKDENRASPELDLPLNNNKILKKIRVAFELKDDDMKDIVDSVGFAFNKQELNAFFRKEGHKNYRSCGDQFMRYFLKGLTQRVRAP